MRVALLGVAVLAAACDTGTVHLAVADAPVDDADRVVIQFDRVTFERDDGEVETFELAPPRAIDLLAFSQGDSAPLVAGERVDAARYRAVILGVSASGDGSDSFVDIGGVQRPLQLAASDAGRLRIATSFEIERRGELTLVVDFDLRKSIRSPADPAEPYALVPAPRLHDAEAVGSLFGRIAAALVPSGCTPAVYVYSGHDATVSDEGSATPPYASGIARVSGDGGFLYSVEWLPAGEYTAAFTCDARADEAHRPDDAMAFPERANIDVTAREAARLDFE